MTLSQNIIINLNLIIILILIYIQVLRHAGKTYYHNTLFLKILRITFIMLIVDILARFDGHPNTIFPLINQIGNFLLFIMTPILPSIWLGYAHFQIFKDQSRTKKLLMPLLSLNIINTITVILTQFYGWFYYIDSANIYHRGQYYYLSNVLNIGLLLFGFAMIYKNRSIIDRKYYRSLLFFSVPPFIGMILQSFFYGTSLILSGVVISILIVFLNIQSQDIFTDYLTEASNRRKLQSFMKYKIENSNKNKSFSAIMLDLDEFKLINDNYGHEQGDIALQATVEMIKKLLSPEDLIARSGGDEFWIILNTASKDKVEEIIEMIKNEFRKYNLSNELPYHLDFSYGYAVYDYRENLDVDQFQKKVDNLMYENKRKHKEEILIK